MKGFKTATVSGLVLNASDAVEGGPEAGGRRGVRDREHRRRRGAVEPGERAEFGIITGTQIRELVLNNRNYEQLLEAAAGRFVWQRDERPDVHRRVACLRVTSNQVQFSVNGGRPTANNWTIDGADNVDRGANLTCWHTPAWMRSLKLQTLRGTYEAEYGRSASALINVVTRFRHQRAAWRRV